MDRTKAEPKPLGRCMYCTLPVTDQDGLELQAGACFHYRCSREQNRPTFRIIDFMITVIDVEEAIKPHPHLDEHYRMRAVDPFTPRNFMRLVNELIALAETQELPEAVTALKNALARLQKLTASTN